MGKVTLLQLLGIGVWLTVLIVTLVLGAIIWFLDRVDRDARTEAKSSNLATSPIKA